MLLFKALGIILVGMIFLMPIMYPDAEIKEVAEHKDDKDETVQDERL